MALPEGKTQFSTVLDEPYAQWVRVYAERLGISESRFIRNLVEGAIDDDAWLIEMMTTTVGKKLRDVLGCFTESEKNKSLEKKAKKAARRAKPA